MFGRRLPLVGRCALGGAGGFILATVLSPVVLALTGVWEDDFPSSALDIRLVLGAALIGALATVGLVWALDGRVRRALVVAQGMAGFAIAGLLIVAHQDHLLIAPVAGAVAGAALGAGAPAGIPLGAFVGAATFPMAGLFAGAGAWHPALGVLGAIAGLALWGGSMGATVGWTEEAAGPGRSWPAALAGPAGVVVALLALLPAQVAAAAVALRRDPPALCFDPRPLPGSTVLAVADFDGDGDLDALQQRDGAVVLLRNAGGVLSTEPGPPVAAGAPMATGDVDADGDIDVVAVVTVRSPPTSVERFRSDLVVARNDGRAGFTLGPPLTVDGAAGRPTVVDLDGDRAADVVVAGIDGPTVFWSRAGRLERGPAAPAWRNPVLADVNGDGRTDVLASSGPGPVVYRSTGPATFETSTASVPGRTTGVAAADVDGDGDVDLMAGTSGEVLVLTNDGAGRFTPARTLPGGRENTALATGDMDGDGDQDLLAHDEERIESQGAVLVWENLGRGQWSDAARIDTSYGRVIVADLTGDGRADVVSGSRLLVSRPC
jgi:hypothetical protein